MTKRKSLSIIFICSILALALCVSSFLGLITTVHAADDKLTVATLIEDYAEGSDNDQEITNTLSSRFTTTFNNADSGVSTGWTTPIVEGVTFNGEVTVQDFTSASEFTFGENQVALSSIGTDGIEGNKFGLLFKNTSAGVSAIESATFSVPAHALYVLTFNVKLVDVSNGIGLNAKLVSGDTTASMPAIKTEGTEYATYTFLIQGNPLSDINVKLQLFFGNLTNTTLNNEIGYCAVDTIRLFSINNSQYADLTSVSANCQASFSSNSTSYNKISNGYFLFTNNQKWDLSTSKFNDLRPASWTQTTATANPHAFYSVVNTNSTAFAQTLTNNAVTLINPGNATGASTTTTNNNVLLMYNSSATYQTITSNSIILAKNGYYEISFKFNTPALAAIADDETNALSFYITDNSGNKIYSSENMFSYTTHTASANEWTTFHVFIKTDSNTDRIVNFVIKLGTEDATQAGYAYIDDVVLSTKSASTMFSLDSTEADKYLLKTEGDTTEYLATDTALSFEDLTKVDSTKPINRSLSTYEFTAAAVVDGETGGETDSETEQETETTPETSTNPGTDLSVLWYVIPSVLLAVCTIFGLIIFYVQKAKKKIKLPKKAKKNAYDRKKTLEKQHLQREKAELAALKADTEKQLAEVRDAISKTDSEFDKAKSNKMALKAYISKREKLQKREQKLLETIKKAK